MMLIDVLGIVAVLIAASAVLFALWLLCYMQARERKD